MAIGGFGKATLSSRNSSIRKRLHKQLAARRMLLEGLEGRQLMAVGPQLLGIQPNEGSLLENGQVRHIAPNELVFRFDDRAGLDPNTLGGIRIIRAGDDGAFDRASAASDLGSGGAALVEFYATEPGQVGNGIQIQFSRVNRNDSRLPVVRVNGRTIEVEVNSNPTLETRVDDLLRAFDQTQQTAVTSLAYGLRLRGSTTTAIGRTVDITTPLVLGGANAAKVSTDFGAGANLQVRLTSAVSGAAGAGVQVKVTSRDFGGSGSPIVSVAGKVISVELNSNSRYASTVNEFVTAINSNAAASALVKATLVSGSSATRIGTLATSYSPLTLSGISDIEVVPAYVGLGDTSREVVMRFGEALPDDKYRIEILGRGNSALLNASGEAFNGGVDQGISFELDLGAQIETIVPQPVERDANGLLTQARNRIDLYFNDDALLDPGTLRTVNGQSLDVLRQQRSPLFFLNTDVIVSQSGATFTPDVLSSQFYQLFHLAGTLSNTDDVRILPTGVRYYPDANRVTLTFSRNLDDLVDPSNNATLARGELRLRVGTNETKPLPPTSYTPTTDAGDTFANPDNLSSVWTPGAAGSQSILLNAEVLNTSAYQLDFPGGQDEIGNRQNRMQAYFRRNFDGTLVTADSVNGTSTVFYNFQTQLGPASSGGSLLNAITEEQKQRTREVFSLYEQYLGVRFVETANLGLTIAVGDMRAITPFPSTKDNPSLIGSISTATNGVGGEYLQAGALANGQPATVLDSQDFSSSNSNLFGGAFTRAVMQGIGNLLGLGNTDDIAGFSTQKFSSVLSPGVGTEMVFPGDSDIVHGQYLYRPDSKDVDLYQFKLPVAGQVSIETFAERMSQASLLDSQIRLYQQQADGSWTEIAANDDYYSSDSYLQLNLSAGNYIIGVSSSGNNQYDPNVSDSGLGGRSQGKYQLRVDFTPPASGILHDATGTAFDGDADGTPGGVYDFWFRPSGPSNTKFVDKSAAAGGTGTLAAPYKNIKDAISAAQSGDVIRIVGNGGADGRLATPADNLAYEIGFNNEGVALPDGTTLDVPKNVAVFVDAGAILKLRRARIGVGSSSNSVDRSAGSLMVLGTPVLVDSTGAVLKDSTGAEVSGNVYFTTFNDTTMGVSASTGSGKVAAAAGDWGGLDFRSRIDGQDVNRKNYEKLGQFLNYVSHADLRYGGGQVIVDGVSQVITPVQMVDARPTVVFATITKSADAAMSATPNSFLESNFQTPDEQRAGTFTMDYDRVGPELHGNHITGNTVNGLLVRSRTSGGTVDSLTVAGRFDDTDIVHYLPENLQIVGTAGGFTSSIDAPPTTIVRLNAVAGGTFAAGTYNYKLTYVDASGNESPASEATQSITVVANSQIVLSNLPQIGSGSSFTGRRLYRSDATGSGTYVLVANLNASSTSFADTGSSLGAPLNPNAPVVKNVVLNALPTGGTLSIGTYNYKMTYLDAAGNETTASLPTSSVTTVAFTSSIQLTNLPVVTSGFATRRLYRSDATGGGTYTLVANLNGTSTGYVDDGTAIGSPLSVLPVTLRARLDARLAIDPGTVVKLQGSRIEVQTGAQLIAEGTEDRRVVFTSVNDVRYGAGGTFATVSGGTAAAGNWGGLYVGPTASASIDHAVVAYGGGTTRIEGGFADFNAVETQQGTLRLVQSRLENNATGAQSATQADRSGRGTNSAGTIFVRGAQPVLVDNIILNNASSAISVNVSALNAAYVTDWGRSTGMLDRASSIINNQGPLIRENRLDGNGINGMVVRGGILSTEGVWDDTDIVHVVLDEIQVPDFQTYGGLSLKSGTAQSLVVKLDGTTSGITATGSNLDNADRIGGSVRLVGQPGYPVIMTALTDDTVGVGFTPSGIAQTNTDNNAPGTGSLLPTGPEVNNGTLIDDDVAIGTPGQFAFNVGAGGSSLFGGGISAQGRTLLFSNLDVIFSYTTYIDVGADGNAISLGNTTITQAPTLVSDDLVVSAGTFVGNNNAIVNWRVETSMADGVAKVVSKIFLSSSQALGSIRAISYLDEDVNGISDDILWPTGTPGQADFRAYTLDGPERIGFSQGGIYNSSPGELENATYVGWAADRFASLQSAITGPGTTYTPAGNINLTTLPSSTDPDLGTIYGPNDVTTAFAWEVVPTANSAVITTFLELIPQDPSIRQGEWRSVLVDQNSNDRNVKALSETESPQSTTGANESPSAAQYLGELAPNLQDGDETRRLGFQVDGVISQRGDVDVYSFKAAAGTEVWFDIDRTQNSLDTVVELVDANGRTLALSDNTAAEEANPSLLYSSSDMPSQSVHSLRKTTAALYLKNADGSAKDLYSTNPRDAGMRVVLPGEPGSSALYHVRVRSSNLKAGDPASQLLDESKLHSGLSKGAYQLQVRLREQDEVPGSSVTYADIRYAANGLDIRGMPKNSPLLGENSETTAANDTVQQAQQLGNLLQTNRQAMSVAGDLSSSTDVDWFSFNIANTAIRPTTLREYFATVFDVDYADGLGRPDVSIYLFDSNGRLVLSGLSSNMVDDQAAGTSGADMTDLSRGSAGTQDPFIGSVELPAGQYFLAVTNSNNVPRVMTAYTSSAPGGATAALRLQPINGVQLIAEDHIDSQGGSTAVAPQTQVLFPSTSSNVTFDLADVNLYVSQASGLDLTSVYIVNPKTGEVANQVGRAGFALGDIAFRTNGQLRAYDKSPENRNSANDQDNEIDYVNIDPGTGAATATGTSGVQTFHVDGTNAADSNDGMYPEALTFANIGGQERGFFVASRPNFLFPRTNVGSSRPGPSYMQNVLYEFDENSGSAISTPAANKTGIAQAFGAGTQIQEHGYIDTGVIGAKGNILIAKDVTTVSNGVTTRAIRDGQTFVLLDSSNFAATFEFDSGPEVQVNYDPANGFGIVDGMKFTLDGVTYEFETPQGIPGVTAGSVPIVVSETATYKEFIDAIAASLTGGVVVSTEGNRLNFSGATTGNFTELQNRGVFFDLGSSGAVNPGSIKVPFLASDTADTLAARMTMAINTSGIPGLSASRSGKEVTISGGTISNSGPLTTAGAAPGGTVTGIAVLNGVMYAVSDQGGLYRVNSPSSPAFGNVGTYITTSYDLLGINFTGLTAGPANVQGGAFANMLFGIDAAGRMYAFNSAGRLQAVFANGATSVQTGLVNATGLSFSTLDSNLWHVTGQRSSDAGHGIAATPDGSTTTVTGGSSLYFGVDSQNPNQPGYSFPGGAAGAMESQSFSLAGLSAGDKPTLYFNYHLDTEDADAALPLGQSQTDYMRDALRVYASGEDGKWVLVATNNSTRGIGSFDDEFDPLLTGNDHVQELFDNGGQWRQARVPLDAFAGQSNVRLRVEFSTAGGFGFGDQGGKGAQLRLVAGNRLVDGQIFTVHGQDFEIEMGPSLTLPGGSAINVGDSVTIEGVTYVFTDGSLIVANPQVGVPYLRSYTAEQMAAALNAAVLSTIFSSNPLTARPQGSISLNATEQNDSMARALIADKTGDSNVITVTGSIGDNATLADPTTDVDLVRVDLARGAVVDARVRASAIGSSLDSLLRVFDSEGNQLAINDNSGASTDSRLSFTAPKDGTYYFGVSGSGNNSYNPAVSGTGTASNSGNYQLVLSVLRMLNPSVSLNRLQLEGAAHVSVPVGSAIAVQGSLGASTSGAVPVYVNVGMTAAQVGAAVQQSIANAFSNGVTSVYTLRGDTLDLTGLVQYDSFDPITFQAAPSATELSSGPFGATTTFVGDMFSAFNASTLANGNTNNSNPGALRAQNNNFEGAYLDDFVIGVAGRGEMAMTAPADTTFVTDPQFALTNPVSGNPETLVGPYQFEIRGGTEYGVPLLQTATQTFQLTSAVAPQQRLADGVSIQFNGASSFAAGTTFTISDGTRTLTFEMDDIDDQLGTAQGNVPVGFSNFAVDPLTGNRRSESPNVIAARVRDLINSSAVQSVLNIRAVLLNSDAVGNTSDTVVLIGQPSVNVPASVGTAIVSQGTGAQNRQREQGQIVIDSAKISNSSGFGISISAGPRDAVTDAPAAGSPRNTLTLNSDRLATGVVVMNSELVRNNLGGISIAGDTSTTSTIAASVPYARFVNNTLVGDRQRGTGIRVGANASPTLLNNVVSGFLVGVDVAASSASTVIGGTVFHNNSQNTTGSATTGQFPIIVNSSVQLFTDATKNNLYPTAVSPVIDSSIDSLQDRPSIASVKSAIGISASPILTPQYDVNGMLRVDDPNVSSPSGLGENVFKDRGAQDRADFIGPSVYSIAPADNDVAGLDRNPSDSVIELSNVTLPYFDIQLFDGLERTDPVSGSNIDDSTVSSASVLLTKDGAPLVEGIDYRFGYDATTNTIRLTPLAGIWTSGSVYKIRFVNAVEYGVNTLDARSYTDGASITVVDKNSVATAFEIDSGFRITVPSNGTTAAITDGTYFVVDDGARRLTYEFDNDGSIVSGRIAITVPSTATATDVARLIQAALTQSQLQFTVTEIAAGQLQLDGSRTSAFLPSTSGLTVTGAPGVTPAFGLQIPLVAGRPVDFVDGETFTIQRSGNPVTFELDTNGSVTSGNIAVRFAVGAGASVIGNALVSAITNAGLGLAPAYAGNGLVTLGGDATTVLGLASTQLTQVGVAGQKAALRVGLVGTTANDATAVALQLAAAINAAGLTGITASAVGTRVVVQGATSVTGSQVQAIQRITDLAGNAMKSNQPNGETSVTIFVGEGLDYGDAPDPTYPSKKANNGARHTVVTGFSLGATVSSDADAKLTNADEGDDGVTFTQSIVAAFSSSLQVSVTRPSTTAAFLSGWIDFNRDGVFSASERIANQLPLTQALTTLSYVVPAGASVGTTYARFRMSSDKTSIVDPTGAAPDGEVEDYQVTIVGNPYKNQSNALDVSGDGHVSAIDVLQIINYLNNPANPTTLSLPRTTSGPSYYDVNGDGFVSAIDALLVINYLNNLPASGEGEGEGDSAASLGRLFGTADATAGDWVGDLVSSVIPMTAAPAITAAADQEEEVVTPVDAFFANVDSDDDVPVVAFSGSAGNASAADAVWATDSIAVSSAAEDLSQVRAAEMARSRLASWFRR